MHVAHSFEGDKAGDEGAAVAVESWVSVSAERQERAGEAGHSVAALPHGHLRERMLLARAQREN